MDNEQLLLALRGIPTSTTSAKVLAYSPFTESVQRVSINFASEASENFTFTNNGTETTTAIAYRPVSIVLDEKNPGATQTVWIAKPTPSTSSNKFRNMMLYLETPLSYAMGSLQYKLISATY